MGRKGGGRGSGVGGLIFNGAFGVGSGVCHGKMKKWRHLQREILKTQKKQTKKQQRNH